MADVESEVVAEAPPEDEVEAFDELPDESEGDPKPSLAELITEENLDDVLGLAPVQTRIAALERAAVDRAEAKLRSEQRRNLNPQVVAQAAAAVLGDAGIDPQNLTRSMSDRLTNLYTTVRTGAAEQIAEAIPQAFFDSYALPQETISGYLDAMNSGDTDGAIKTLVDGAVAQKQAEAEASVEARVKAEVDKRVKAELEAASNGSGNLSLPSTSRGTRASNTQLALTSMEIEKMPGGVWTALPDEVKRALEANVGQADAQRGAETFDISRLERVAALVK